MTNFPISLTGDPIPDSQQPKLAARFVKVANLRQGDIVYRSGGWRRVHHVGNIQQLGAELVSKVIIGSDILTLPVNNSICRKVIHEID